MSESPLKIVILGLSITSSWGNGHATTYRGLVRELVRRGHDVVFLERDVPWYASNRDMPRPPWGQTHLYQDLAELDGAFKQTVSDADLVIVGSYVPEGVAVGEWALDWAEGLVAFYDIDTPVTLAKLEKQDFEYLHPELIPEYDLYLSFTGGPTLERLERQYGSPMARPLYCSVDSEAYYPEPNKTRWELGYLGTYSDDRQPRVEALLLEPARALTSKHFVVAGPQYPGGIAWPDNVERIDHIPPPEHRAFYNAQRFTLNVTRDDMIAAGYAPSVRLFEAAACGVPIISDVWEGIETILEPEREILLAHSTDEVVDYLRGIEERERQAIAERARQRVLSTHTAADRARELEDYYYEALN